ncbi:putative sporulation protein (polysaccharide deacetylase family) [Desulfohalotomaculum tongense]|uniref:polysaccharide deacetylase family protein n=1 Tax=Desulforadius tongensis TaxID=1216062 RepID=UPI00195B5BE9|nr:polysaccharide deacetylase family protein [Desulforadius tongensis]MBM7854448.1 putative sporulation protein (polysaccharide deacetylase family) [Desulforadius tongensis]
MKIIFIRRGPLFKLAAWIILAAFLIILGYMALQEDYEPTLAPIYQGNEDKKEIALTVNVYWGEEYLPQMLKIMEENNVKATFFIGGQWAEKFPRLLKKISTSGHEIGSHGYSHPHPDYLSKSGNIREITRSERVISKITGKKPTLFAPPYGERGKSVLAAVEELGYQCILWSVDTIDWQRPAPETIVNRVTQKAHNGAIVLMHPTAPTVRALPEIITALKNDGYEFVTVSELIKNIDPRQTER